MSQIEGQQFALGALKDPEDVRDFPVRKIMRAVPLPASVDYEKKMPPVRNQFQRGACVAFATAATKEYQERMQRKTLKDLDFSEEWIYGQVRQAGGGAYPRDAVKLLAAVGVCREKLLPYNSSITDDSQEVAFVAPPVAKINAKNYMAQGYARLGSIEDMKQSLVVNGPFIIGVDWQNGWFAPKDKTSSGYPLLKPNDGGSAGGHAICIVGYDDKIGGFKFRNSWSNQWGRNGYAYFSYDTIKENLNDAWTTFDISNPKIINAKVDELLIAKEAK